MRLVIFLILTLYLGILFTSCDEDLPCYECGFNEGPYIPFENNMLESFVVSFQNAEGLGDSLVCLSGRKEKVPIDANSTKMHYQVKSSKGIDSLSLSYTIEVKENKQNEQWLFVKNIDGQWDTIYRPKVHNLEIPFAFNGYDSSGQVLTNNWEINYVPYFKIVMK
jgi:hypothetical protein